MCMTCIVMLRAVHVTQWSFYCFAAEYFVVMLRFTVSEPETDRPINILRDRGRPKSESQKIEGPKTDLRPKKNPMHHYKVMPRFMFS